MKINEEKIIYYNDELNDEFSGANIKPRFIDENYKYIHKNIFWDFTSAFLQNVFTMPIKWGYGLFKLHIKYIGKEKLKKYKNDSFFIYVNHTQVFADVFIPSLPIYPNRNHFIVNPENVSMKILGNSVQLLGAIPVPGNKKAMKNFLNCIDFHVKKKHPITIYPEAHIWPYYTKIRPFKDVSFKYPIKYNKPSFCITNTYQKYGKNNDKIRLVSYIDGPFWSDDNISEHEKKTNLRNKIYNKMVERSKNSNIEIIKYVKRAK